MAVSDMISAAVGGSVGAYIVYEIVQAINYTGPGEQILPLLALVVIAAAVMQVMEDSDSM